MNKSLTRAMKKAVELGVFPKVAGQDEYLRHWANLEKILEAAGNPPNNPNQADCSVRRFKSDLSPNYTKE